MKEENKESKFKREKSLALNKDKNVFYTIGEVSKLCGVKPYVLRYWETEFTCLRPELSDSGHRLYKQADIDLIMRIKRLLYDKDFTIRGAKRVLRLDYDKNSETTMIFEDYRPIIGDAEKLVEYIPLSRTKKLKQREIFTKEITDMGDFIVRRLAPGVYATIDKPLPTTAH